LEKNARVTYPLYLLAALKKKSTLYILKNTLSFSYWLKIFEKL
jgi:hypothetical protein